MIPAKTALAITLLAGATAFAAPDEDLHGKSRGYPAEKAGWDRIPYRVGNNSRFDTLFAANRIAAPSVASKLIEAPDELPAKVRARFQDYFDKYPNTGLLVLKDGKVLFERYQYDRKPSDRMHGWSMSKSVLALLVGAAVADGSIRSVRDTAETYVPELKGTLHGETSIKDLLQMSTGSGFVHRTREEGGQLGQVYDDNLLQPKSDSLLLIKEKGPRPIPAGTKMNYNELAPITLTHVVVRATGKSLSAYAEEKLWKPMGAEAGASWAADSKGVEWGCVGFSATVRDWGRLGLIMANDGSYNGRQILPRDWLIKTTTLDPADKHLLPDGPAYPARGYGYLTWIYPYSKGRLFAMLGHHGQNVIVNPEQKVVVVRTGVDSDKGQRELGALVIEYLDGL
jgi:CubicO group peptidase (beta-lactamase class C family)